ncbi:putative membrane protein [Bifidobacterium actinocoloniiforme DSM 22766]|uniref:Putative membrane protein n=1 Tax=Bifidobacterium actinocoloniiforme DSM 22766 TaxID=1437605 RepID=A0A086Z1A0_9BIFI|nr:MMPL family transporter [Bifidobacterium actinocoloniiforme]KFI40300.1 putative membrane protein [Bifidobacterium actinocoloniiforme DSM 22766]
MLRAVDLCKRFLRHRKAVAAVFALFTALCALCYPLVKVNYSMVDYLPSQAPSVVALKDMRSAFGSGIPNARLYAEGLDPYQADRLSRDLADVEGVTQVMWLGSAVDNKEPVQVQDARVVKPWKRGDGYLYQLTVDAARAVPASSAIRQVAWKAGAKQVSLDGEVATAADTEVSTSKQVVQIMLVAIAIVILILLLTSHSWFEPVIFLLVIGAAIIMNMGSNILLPDISFVSQICGAVLQLAVSMDYAIVLLHTFRRQEALRADPEEAMAYAMVKGFSVVLSSAAVTFFGFLSLTVMRFGVGVNMGLVLAKGIVFSFLSVMLLMPCLILLMLKPLKALEHRYLMPSFGGFARLCQRVMIPAALVVVALALPSYLAQSRTNFVYGSSDFINPASQQGRESARISQVFGQEETWVVMVPEGHWAKEQATLDDLKAMNHVNSVTSYITVAGRATPVQVAPEATLKQVMNHGWSRMVVSLDVESDSDTAYDMVSSVRRLLANRYGSDYRLIGSTVSLYDLRDTVRQDSLKVSLFSIGSIALILMFMTRSLTIPLVVLLAIEASIWMNLAVPYFTGQTINYIGYLVIDSVQLGAAVDYAIIYTREYLERRAQVGAKDASRQAIQGSAITILTSSSILVCAGVAVRLIATNGVISELGTLLARGAFFAMVLMFLLLPCLLRVFDGLIRHTSIGLRFATASGQGGEAGGRLPDPGEPGRLGTLGAAAVPQEGRQG